MKNASKTSSRPSDREQPRQDKSTESIAQRRRKRTHEFDCLAPPRPRRRIREARRWLDELYAATTNGLPRDRWPGQRLFMPSETFEICDTALAELEERDPELSKAVAHVTFWDNVNARGISMDEFKRRAVKNCARLAAIRATMRPREFK
jgi:hypothetical protein